MRLLKLFFILIFMLSCKISQSQYSYLNVNPAFEGLTLKFHQGHSRSNIRSLSTSVSFTHRFKRHLGAGLSFSQVIYQATKFSFHYAGTVDSPFLDSYLTNSGRYRAVIYDYDFEYSNMTSMFFRVYADKSLNFYLDTKVSYFSITESFRFYRPFRQATYNSFGELNRPAIPEEDIDFVEIHHKLVPGFSAGLTPHISDNIFIDFNLGWDFIFFGDESFSYLVPFKYNFSGGHDYVDLKSQMRGVKSMFNIQLGIGYYF